MEELRLDQEDIQSPESRGVRVARILERIGDFMKSGGLSEIFKAKSDHSPEDVIDSGR